MLSTHAWTLSEWQAAYANNQSPDELLNALIATLSAQEPDWISVLDSAGLDLALAELQVTLDAAGGDRGQLPLYGVPFAVKDNIDVLGFATTAACPEFSYQPTQDAQAVALLKAAGAIVVGKTNLDQFATGLVGTRSPYGSVPNPFDADYISGGSSSGSATVVARGLVPFALGTDTAGSGRVPAGLNNLVGLKGTCGAVSTRGVVPACQSLDCVTVFAQTLGDAEAVFRLAAQFDAEDPFSRRAPFAQAQSLGARPKLGIPQQPEWYGDTRQEEAWAAALSEWEQQAVELVPLDFSLLSELAALLYDGPWVAERDAAVGEFMRTQEDADGVNPVVRGIIGKAAGYTATDAFKGQYRRQALQREIEQQLVGIDALMVPTVPTFPTIAAVNADPVVRNSELGTYTNFVNFNDMCALAIPAGFRDDGLPFGVTLIARAWQDTALQSLAAGWLARQPRTLGATGKAVPVPEHRVADSAAPEAGMIRLAVVGAHLTGMPLNFQLTERDAVLVEQTHTAPEYRLFALANTTPPKPGLAWHPEADGRASIAVELWDMPTVNFGSFVDLIPPPLGIGTLRLDDGRLVKGFICEGQALGTAEDITGYGGWRAYVTAR